MKQTSELNLDQAMPRPWLKTYHEARKQQTVEIVKATVDQLVRDERSVTIEAICRLSVEVDPLGKGVGKAGILGNEAAYAYYREHSFSYQTVHRRKQRFAKGKQGTASSVSIDPNRDSSRVRSRYLSRTKVDLVERLLLVEQAYAECQQQLARLQFALADLQRDAKKR
jgi:hypothetical protein